SCPSMCSAPKQPSCAAAGKSSPARKRFRDYLRSSSRKRRTAGRSSTTTRRRVNEEQHMPVERMWRTHDLKPSYDVVIIGAGVHGLAIAYYLGKRGITNVAVLDKGYLGGGASGRNTAIIRSNYRTPEGVAFYDESVKLYENLALELDYNVMFSQQGHLTVAHTERGVITLRER